MAIYWLRLRVFEILAPASAPPDPGSGAARGAIHSTGYIRGLEDIGDLSELFKLRDSEGDSSIA